MNMSYFFETTALYFVSPHLGPRPAWHRWNPNPVAKKPQKQREQNVHFVKGTWQVSQMTNWEILVAPLLLVAMPFAPSSSLLLVVRPGASSSALPPSSDNKLRRPTSEDPKSCTSLLGWRQSLLGARASLLVAPGIATSNKKLLGTKGIATRSKDAIRLEAIAVRLSVGAGAFFKEAWTMLCPVARS